MLRRRPSEDLIDSMPKLPVKQILNVVGAVLRLIAPLTRKKKRKNK